MTGGEHAITSGNGYSGRDARIGHQLGMKGEMPAGNGAADAENPFLLSAYLRTLSHSKGPSCA